MVGSDAGSCSSLALIQVMKQMIRHILLSAICSMKYCVFSACRCFPFQPYRVSVEGEAALQCVSSGRDSSLRSPHKSRLPTGVTFDEHRDAGCLDQIVPERRHNVHLIMCWM